MHTLSDRFKFHRAALRLWWLVAGLAGILPAVSVRATTVVAPSFNQLVGQADYVVRAVVKSVASEMRTTGDHRHILTKVELEVKEVISGTPPQPLVLEMLGGRVGDEEMVVEGTPKFQVGDEDILFVHGNGRMMNPLVALMHGRYPIKRDASGREYMTRSNGAPLHNEQEVSQAMTGSAAADAIGKSAPVVARSTTPALTPADFTSRIKTAFNQNRSPALEN